VDLDGVKSVLDHFGVRYRIGRSGKPWIATECLLSAFKHADPIDEARHPGASVEINPDGPSRYVCRSTNCGSGRVFLLKTIVRQLLRLLKEPTPQDVEIDRRVHAVEVDTPEAQFERAALKVEKKSESQTNLAASKATPGVIRRKTDDREVDLLPETALDRFSTELPDYVYKDRGLTPETVKLWGLRYDKRYGRVVIPIRRADGRLVGYTGRILPELDVPSEDGHYPTKYFNYRGLNKDLYLFGAHLFTRSKPVILVEGPFDVMKTRQALGSAYNVGATLGGGFSDAHYRTVMSAMPQVVFLFQDADTAGQQIVQSIRPRLSSVVTIRVTPTGEGDPGGMPDDDIRAAFDKAISSGVFGA